MAAAGERGLSEAAHGHRRSLEAGSEITDRSRTGRERERERELQPGTLDLDWLDTHSPDSTLSKQGSPLVIVPHRN